MTEFGELFGVDEKQTLRFFMENIDDILKKMPEARDGKRFRVDVNELKHVASVLAHHAITATSGGDPAIKGNSINLTEVYDNFINPERANFSNAELMLIAGSRILLLAGFFGSQESSRHNIRWYCRLGRDYYAIASDLTPEVWKDRKECLRRVSVHFPIWVRCLRKLSKYFHEKPYLIQF